ncbi:tRNA (5-methylaminomethyl-2-thiouridylate)-methyltransferase [Schaalia turicensis ACS-279-V-Col4]|uniref:tRNA-specific 2-thiouridylase MnmA n=2 Tax=Actinomycetaceae TaxID=2049 RepID=K0YRC8_9ACTO|nr:tRNA 2-thiouridine(34) synthase MnmA [Schaalia turicensis]EJZ86412.1 tRNA (5-methylaminomethyl-2-thiouridylate)-methyltransferase [Schaalia turicensis ACS-279-V-Col4]
MRVLAALSGGVDSAVAAAKAVEAGHDVVGVHMALSSQPQECRIGSRGCCSVEDAGDAARAAEIMGIPFYVWDLAQEFEETVIEDFVEQYKLGHTPNPCVRCNEFVKFRELATRAKALGFDAVCTGHYAAIVDGPSGPELHRGADSLKDQSYVLAIMGRDELSRVLLPLGDAPTKAWVRSEAQRLGLGVFNKPDSYDICFIPDGDTQGFLRTRLGSDEGEIVSPDGEVLGTHQGYWNFTVGQRRGLHIDRPAEDGKPRYVLETRPESNQVVVGASTLLSVDRIECEDVVWLAPDDLGASTDDLFVQVRAHGTPVPVSLVEHDSEDEAREGAERRLVVSLSESIHGVAAGQSLVMYRDTRVLGEATIMRASRASSFVA